MFFISKKEPHIVGSVVKRPTVLHAALELLETSTSSSEPAIHEVLDP